MRKSRRSAAVLSAIGVCSVLVLGATSSAFADDQAQSGDVVGVGSDTVQYASDFIANGSPSGAAGYNASVTNRDISFFATGDGNGRALYDSTGQLLQGGNGLEGTTSITLRAGTLPVARPDGSGDGIAALTNDSVGGTGYEGLPNNSIQYVRASRLPKGSEQTNCSNNSTGCKGLHVYEFAQDNLEMAKWTGGTSNVPAAGLSISELQSIYKCTITTWNALPGNSGGSGSTIIPVIPQSGSGTRNFFLADLGTGGTSLTPGSCVHTSEEHDPTGITHATQTGSTTFDPADAIEPFSVGRARLAASGYFANSQEPTSDFAIGLITGCSGVSGSWAYGADDGFCGATDSGDTNQLANGGTPLTAGDGNAVYDSTRGLFFIVRDADLTSTTSFQPGAGKNFAQVLFEGSGNYIQRSSTASLIKAAFLVPNYHDLGDDSAG
jgi:ABC-type phosphate transport system substrate-binding protein